MTVSEVINYLHEIAPNEFQESYDNSGLIIGNENNEVKGILVSLDCVESILDEAIQLGVNLIVSHHPIIFSGLKKITDSNYVERVVRKAIKNDINIFAIHTNLDNVHKHGVNKNIANRLGLIKTEILFYKSELIHNNEHVGSGIIGYLEEAIKEEQFLAFVKAKMETSLIKHTNLLERSIKKVAICGGSGRFLLQEAINQGADIFITSDFKYHEFFDADNKIVIADIGHFESEQFTIKMLYEILTNKFNTFATHYTKVNTNPVNYF